MPTTDCAHCGAEMADPEDMTGYCSNTCEIDNLRQRLDGIHQIATLSTEPTKPNDRSCHVEARIDGEHLHELLQPSIRMIEQSCDIADLPLTKAEQWGVIEIFARESRELTEQEKRDVG